MAPATLAYVFELLAFALGGTLLQGVLLWSSWRLSSRLIPVARPGLRYRVASAHFALLAALPVLTIVSFHLLFATMGGEISREKPAIDLPPPTVSAAYLGLLASVAACWLCGAGWQAIGLFGELARLAAMPLHAAPAALVATVDRLRVNDGGHRRLETRIAAVAGPQVIGFRRAVLMVPADFMARLPAAEREAVLLHELAHARRQDFACNLLQRLGLMLVWFHPAAWALYRSLAFEREAACDAAAVRRGAAAKTLAQGLLRLAEDRHAHPVAMASSGGAALSVRLHRLLSPERAAPSLRARAGGAVGVLAVLGAALALAAPGLNAARMQDRYIASGFGPTVVVNARDPAGSFALRIRQGRVVQASIERQAVPSERIIQQGDTVLLLGANRRPAVSLRVFANGRIRWNARG
ncbi:hypothetical protein ASE35_19600 [Lysobacter sp. Root916]|uniref:M56 family metallopeptidase n=1 Tax=Lysobacter sp. Root916 TaxID=1736606 RepID=UPI000710CDC5|nr:M56 family metallopeptidase [Lysobacter sp. Root916]KRD28706.1 hypothetical protein ASE35_19600 [Lysobacter sp. Root916]